MKCLAILSSVPDIVFFTADKEYLDQLQSYSGRISIELPPLT